MTGPGGSGKQRTPGTRIAIARVARRSRTKRSSGVLGLVMFMLLLAVVVVTGTAVLTAGSAATALLASLEQGLPDVKTFEQLKFSQPTKVYDRTHKHLLAQFYTEKRKVVTFKQIPPLVLDVTTAVEDRTFWENQGYDLQSTIFASLANLTGAADRGGASTITQQLVRAVLLPKALMAQGADLYERKAKELIQSAKLTDAFPGVEGKQRIITAYLNQIFYGHNAYGIAAAAKAYFGETMSQLTLGQAALLAGLPQSPAILDLYRPVYSKTVHRKGKTRIVVQTCKYGQDLQPIDPTCFPTAPVARRDFILRALLDGKGKWTKPTRAQVLAALNEPVILAGDQPNPYVAPHFVVAVKQELDQMFRDGEPVETGGYDVTTTLDYNAQKLAEKYVMAGAVLPNLRPVSKFLAARRALKIRSADYGWINNLRASSIHNAALVAEDYRTGDVLAYVGSADYYDRYKQKSKKFDPKFDVAGIGFRQPGSAWKPMVYTSAFQERVITPGSVLLDVTTPFPGWPRPPQDAHGTNHGPVLARYALQQSLNIPAIRTLAKLGNRALDPYVAKAGFQFIGGHKTAIGNAGLAVAIGTAEVRVIDMVSAFGAFGNGGQVTTPRFLLRVRDQAGKSLFTAGAPQVHKVWSPQAAWLTANILEGNSDPHINPYWGTNFQILNGPGGQRRIMALKTGTTNDVKDVSTYGLLPQPTSKSAPAIAVGVWMGNSNHAPPNFTDIERFSTDTAGKIWRSFMRDLTAGWPVVDFQRPKGVVRATIDGFTGGKTGPWTSTKTKTEWFIAGTEPGSKGAVDKPGLLYDKRCDTYVVDLTNADGKDAPDSWKAAVRGYMRRHPKSAGGPMAPPGNACYVAPTPKPTATPDPNATPSPNATPTPKPKPTTKPHKPPKPTPMPTKRPHKTPKQNSQPAGTTQAVVADGVAAVAGPAVVAAVAEEPRPTTPGLPIQRQPVDMPGGVAARPIRVGRRRKTRITSPLAGTPPEGA